MKYKVRLYQSAYVERWFTVTAESKQEAMDLVSAHGRCDCISAKCNVEEGKEQVTYTDDAEGKAEDDVFPAEQGKETE